jgi:3-deoxy-D-manno-octulosonate 8-phosphate phosphatase (KDO 8-P phosphatase)
MQRIFFIFLLFITNALGTVMNTAQKDKLWFSEIVYNHDLSNRIAQIKLIIFDVDGTLTNAGIAIDDQGEGARIFDIQDGYAFRPALQAGLKIALISGKKNISTIIRGAALGIPEEFCIVGCINKPEAITTMQAKLGIPPEQTAIFGDDHLDFQVQQAGLTMLFACPANAPFYYQDAAHMVVPRTGGTGAARLLLDLILYVQDKHFSQETITKSLAKQSS